MIKRCYKSLHETHLRYHLKHPCYLLLTLISFHCRVLLSDKLQTKVRSHRNTDISDNNSNNIISAFPDKPAPMTSRISVT